MHAAERTTARALWASMLLLASALAVNCNEQNQSRTLNTQPEQPTTAARSDEPAQASTEPAEGPAATQPSQREQPTTGPATREQPKAPETRPEPAKPESTYSSRPPYPVSLYVKSPEEKQPGWLQIVEMADAKQIAAAHGKFPEKNRIYVDTENVRRIRIHVGHLPLRANERVVLQIDRQGMVISRSRPFTTLELSPTGAWVVVKEKDDR